MPFCKILTFAAILVTARSLAVSLSDVILVLNRLSPEQAESVLFSWIETCAGHLYMRPGVPDKKSPSTAKLLEFLSVSSGDFGNRSVQVFFSEAEQRLEIVEGFDFISETDGEIRGGGIHAEIVGDTARLELDKLQRLAKELIAAPIAVGDVKRDFCQPPYSVLMIRQWERGALKATTKICPLKCLEPGRSKFLRKLVQP